MSHVVSHDAAKGEGFARLRALEARGLALILHDGAPIRLVRQCAFGAFQQSPFARRVAVSTAGRKWRKER